MKNLREREAAYYLGLSVHTLQKWRIQGKGPSFLRFGRAILYQKIDLDNFISNNKFSSTSQYNSNCGGQRNV